MNTVQDLINELQKCDLNSPVEIAVGVTSKPFPAAYCKPAFVISKQNGVHTRIKISLPEGMAVIQRKPKT